MVWTSWFLVFFAMAIWEAGWVLCVEAVANNKAVAASLYSGIIWALAGWITVSYVVNIWLLVPTILGSIVGTYLTMKIPTWWKNARSN